MTSNIAISSAKPSVFRPALLIIDMQQDFCPPDGSLAVPQGRTLAPLINSLLSLPFAFKIATKDWHPASHVSFAPNHPAPGNKPFECTAKVTNPKAQGESKETTLWPVHCVQGSKGADLIEGIDWQNVDMIVRKGLDERVEMYSVFLDVFGNACATEIERSVPDEFEEVQREDPDVATILKSKGITDVFVVGLAGDYCVKYTAIDSIKAGFRTFLIEEGTKCVGGEKALESAKVEMQSFGVKVVSAKSREVEWIC